MIVLVTVTLSLVARAPARAADPAAIEDGRVLYVRFCSSCHGLNADGRGPVAGVLQTPPANLRLLGARYGNPLPAAKIADFIDGRAAVAAHGDRDMPVWGERFNDMTAEGSQRERAVKDRLAKIIGYLQSIQDQPSK